VAFMPRFPQMGRLTGFGCCLVPRLHRSSMKTMGNSSSSMFLIQGRAVRMFFVADVVTRRSSEIPQQSRDEICQSW